MKKTLPLIVAALLVLTALAARTRSPGAAQSGTVNNYLQALAQGREAQAWELLTDSLALLVSPEFMEGLAGTFPSGRFFMEGLDGRGIRMTASAGAGRTVWLEWNGSEYRVSGDELLDGLLGQAVLLCRAAALSGSVSCPVSGRDYVQLDGAVQCPSGHLGAGLSFSPEACRTLREEAAGVVRAFVSRGYGQPSSLESIYDVTGGELGRRGGWRCPDNAYSYYALRSDSVVCGHHRASTPVNP